MKRTKGTILIAFALALLAVSPLSAQKSPDSIYLFRFVPEKDMFYVPYGGNDEQLERLVNVLQPDMERLRSGQMYICVSSYGAMANDTLTAARMAYLRCHRVKSELITRGGVTEAMFLTERHIPAAYGVDSLRNVVVVTFPAGTEKVAELAGTEAAARVEAYNKEVSGEAGRERFTAEKKAREDKTAKERAEQERLAARQAACEKAEAGRLAAEQAEKERLAAEEQARLQNEEAVQAARKRQDAGGWYVGAQGGVPFGVSAFSSFGADKTRAGWSAGVYGGYRFNPVLSLEVQAAWGEANTSVRSCCAGYWLGSDGNRYEAAVAGMEGWSYGELKSRVATQRYGVQLNVNLLGLFATTEGSRWTLELSPQLSAVGTKATFRTIADNAGAMKGATRWHFGAGGNVQAGYAITCNLNLGIYTGITYLTGKPLDGTPEHLHKANYIWESGLKLGWSFGHKGKEAH